MKLFDDVRHTERRTSAALPRLVWTMVNVNEASEQGDAHVISVEDDKHILIDAGQRHMAAKYLLPFLRESAIKAFELVIISHAHKDHYGGLDVLLENDIEIGKLYFNLPDRSLCLREIPWGCDYDDVLAIRERLIARGINIRTVEPGLRFEIGQQTHLDVLYAFDGIETPVGKTDINDTSPLMKLHHGQHTFLFTGDLNEDIGGYLAETADNLRSDVLKIPHHGVEPVAPESFFAKVAPRYGLVSAPESYWYGKMGARVRSWFEKHDIPVFVNGRSGHISVVVESDELHIYPELAEFP